MSGLFELVLKTSIYGSITGILILTIKLIFKEKLIPKWSYLLWLTLVIKLIVPFGPESNFSIFNKVENTKISINSNYNNNQYKNLENLVTTLNDNNIKSTTSNINAVKNKPITSKDLLINNIEYLNSNSKIFNFKDFINKYIKIVWILVTINMFAFTVISYLILNMKLHNYNIKSPQRLNSILNSSKEKFNIKRNIKIIVNDYINTPAITGIFNPRILLPLSMIDLKGDELKYVFLHELAHYKRKDNFVNGSLIIIQSIHWFNPLIWYFFKKLREDMELATDEKVLNILNTKDYNNYGLTLLNVLSKMNETKSQPNFIGMAKNKKDMERRIMNIKFIKNSKGKKVIFTAIGALILGVTSPAILTSAQSNAKLSYADTKESKVSKDYKLNEMQNTFFYLVKFMEENENISVDDLRSNIKKLKLQETKQFDKNNKADIYVKGDEEIIVYYFKNDGQGPFIARNIEYSINSKDKDINKIRLMHTNTSADNKSISLQIATESVKELNSAAKILNLDNSKGKLYPTYIKLLKEIESKNSFTKKDLLEFNSNFKQPGNTPGVDDHFAITYSDTQNLKVRFNDKSGQISDISLGDERFGNSNKEDLFTKTKHYQDEGWNVQGHYSKEYNLGYNETGHIITIDNKDTKITKSTFMNFMNEYNK